MATYILLTRFTSQGVENIKDSPGRLEAAKKAIAGLGAELKAFYLAMGQYDAVVVVEAPDDETVAKASIAIASQGNVRMETLRAFDEDEYRRIVGALP
jgi:uncharacterized protein with GYD domain